MDSVELFGPRRGPVIETNLDIPRSWGNLHPDPNGERPAKWEWPAHTVEKRDLGGNPTWSRLRDNMVETDALGSRYIWYKLWDDFVNPGERYVFGARVKGEATVINQTTREPVPIPFTRVRLIVHWKDATGGIIGQSQSPWTPFRTATNVDPLRTAVFTAPAGAKTAWCFIDLSAQELPVTTVLMRPTFVDVREAQVIRLEAGEEDPGYIDGTNTPPQGVTWLWEVPEEKSGRTQVIDESDFWKRADEILRVGNFWEERVVKLRWNAQEAPAVAATLDIQDRVRVERRGVDMTDYRILSMRHTVDAGRWMIELHLAPNNLA